MADLRVRQPSIKDRSRLHHERRLFKRRKQLDFNYIATGDTAISLATEIKTRLLLNAWLVSLIHPFPHSVTCSTLLNASYHLERDSLSQIHNSMGDSSPQPSTNNTSPGIPSYGQQIALPYRPAQPTSGQSTTNPTPALSRTPTAQPPPHPSSPKNSDNPSTSDNSRLITRSARLQQNQEGKQAERRKGLSKKEKKETAKLKAERKAASKVIRQDMNEQRALPPPVPNQSPPITSTSLPIRIATAPSSGSSGVLTPAQTDLALRPAPNAR